MFFDADKALVLGGPGPGVCFVGQEQPQAFPFVSHGAVAVQHVEDDHVSGIITETLHSKLVLASDNGVIFHRHILSSRFLGSKKAGQESISCPAYIQCIVNVLSS